MSVLAASHVVPTSARKSKRGPRPNTPHPPPSSGPQIPTDPPQNPKVILFALFLQTPDDTVVLKQVQASPHLRNYLLDARQILDLLKDLASSRDPRNALRALLFAQRLGCKVKDNAYEAIAHILAAAKRWDMLLAVISGEKKCPWEAILPDYRALHGILDEFEQCNFKPSRRTFHLVITGHIRNHDLEKAKECLQKMEAAGWPADASTHALVGTLYQSLGPDEQVKQRTLEAIPYVASASATAAMNSLLQLRLRIHDLEQVFYLLSIFDQSKVSALVSILAASRTRQGDETIPTGKAKPSLGGGVAPDAITFAMFIDHFARYPDLPSCLAVLDHMLVVGIPPTVRTITSLIRAYCFVGHGGMAVRIVAAMCDSEKTPPEMFQGLPSPTAYELPLDISGIPISVQIFNTLLRAVLRTHGLPTAHIILSIMRANSVEPDSTTQEIIASHLQRARRAQPGMLMKLLRDTSLAPARPTLRHAHIVLSSIMRYEKYLVNGVGWDAAAVRFSPKRVSRAKPYPKEYLSPTVSHLDPLAGLGFGRRHRRAFAPLAKSLVDRGIKSDKATMALRIRHEAVIKGDMDTATEIFQTMVARGMHPNQYHFTGDFESAVDVMRSAARSSAQPNVLMFTILIVGYARRADPDMALRIFRRMVAAGIKPDVPAIDAVASAFFIAGSYTMCWRVLTSLWSNISPTPPTLEYCQPAVCCQVLSITPPRRTARSTDHQRGTTGVVRRYRRSLERVAYLEAHAPTLSTPSDFANTFQKVKLFM
ncbi:hypothetical protein C8J57DRAFT_1704373 [Mycena rebaudengoi]|nr:hypothetical protein C8J57DRAFT_1704373 [Mycena rebaudengoi]